MSPRAASRLESIGFERVYDYVAGKADWGSAALPLEGAEGSETRVGAYVRTDVPNCRLDDNLQDVCARLEESGWDTCFVLNEERVVLGRIGRRAIRDRAAVTARGRDDPRPEHDQAERTPTRGHRAHATTEPDLSPGHDAGRPAGRAAHPRRRRAGPRLRQ